MTNVDDPPLIHQIELRPLAISGELVPVREPETTHLPGETPVTAFLRRYSLFIGTFVLPLFFAVVYLFFIASDRYMSEAQFVVRSAGGSSAEATAALVQSRGMSRARDETYVVAEYIISRDALARLMAEQNLNAVFANANADFINRFPNFYSRNDQDSYFKYYRRMVSSSVDGGSGISTIQVVAFTPEDAHRIVEALLRSAEALINRLNERAEADALVYATKVVDNAKMRVVEVEGRLAAYRNQIGMVDPSRETASSLQTIERMSTELAQIQATAEQQKKLTPNAPGLATMQQKVKAYRDESDRRKLELSGAGSLIAAKIQGYDQLILEREIAAKALASAEAVRESARQTAEQQHLYLQTIIQPNVPDRPDYPRRFVYFLATALICAAVFVISRSLHQIAVEHAI